jgi:hypothetical protein
VPTEADSVIVGMGERVNATITLNSSVPAIAAERKDDYAQLNRVNETPSAIIVEQFVAALNHSVLLDTAMLQAASED